MCSTHTQSEVVCCRPFVRLRSPSSSSTHSATAMICCFCRFLSPPRRALSQLRQVQDRLELSLRPPWVGRRRRLSLQLHEPGAFPRLGESHRRATCASSSSWPATAAQPPQWVRERRPCCWCHTVLCAIAALSRFCCFSLCSQFASAFRSGRMSLSLPYLTVLLLPP